MDPWVTCHLGIAGSMQRVTRRATLAGSLVGKDSWSDGLGITCLPCNRIPGKAYHPNTTQGWSTPNCPYSCSVGVPNVASNPNCLDPLDYALAFFGGWKAGPRVVASQDEAEQRSRNLGWKRTRSQLQNLLVFSRESWGTVCYAEGFGMHNLQSY